MPNTLKMYIRKGKTGPEFLDEWVVRIKGRYVDIPLCGCPSRWEADIVKQCIQEAFSSRNASVRMRRYIDEINRYCDPITAAAR